jgi:molecular chaperone DnaK (HSP70)
MPLITCETPTNPDLNPVPTSSNFDPFLLKVREAEARASEDEARREAIDHRNQGESMVYQAEKQLKEFGDK